MKIAHILGYFSAEFGGPPVVAVNLARTQHDLGHEVSIWAAGDPQALSQYDVQGIECHMLPVSWPTHLRRAPELPRQLRARISALDILQLHGLWNYCVRSSAKIAMDAGRPFVLTPHGVLEPWRVDYKKWKKRLFLAARGRRILNGSDCLHALSEPEIKGIRQVGYTGPVAIIHNGVHVDQFRDLPEPTAANKIWKELDGRRVVLFLSRLSPEKGLDVLLPAWSQVIAREESAGAILVLAGPDYGGYAHEVGRLIQANGIQNSVLLTGMVTGKRKNALLSRADVYTLPSHAEGFSISILENLAVGNPVVITPGCNFPEVERVGAGYIVDPTPERVAGVSTGCSCSRRTKGRKWDGQDTRWSRNTTIGRSQPRR